MLVKDIQLPLHDERSCADNLLLAIEDDQDMVSTSRSAHFVPSLLKLLLAHIAHMCQYSQDIEETQVEVSSLEAPIFSPFNTA